MESSRRIAYANIAALETLAGGSNVPPGKRASLLRQAFEMRERWGLIVGERVEMKETTPGRPIYTNHKGCQEKHMKVGNRLDYLGRYLRKENRTSKPSIEVKVYAEGNL